MTAGLTLEWVQPIARSLEVDGKTVTIEPLRVGQLPLVARLAEPLMAELVSAPRAALDAALAGTATESEGAALLGWLVGVIGKHGAAVVQLVAAAAKEDASWVGNLYADRLAALLLVTVEVNADFFSRLLPGLKGLAGELKWPGSKPTGPTSSTS